MKKLRILTVIVLLVLVVPIQSAQAKPAELPFVYPFVTITPYVQTVLANSTVIYNVDITSIPPTGMHCVKVFMYASEGFKVYPNYYSFYNISTPTSLQWKIKVPYKTVKGTLNAKVNWSKDNTCKGIRITSTSNLATVFVVKP